MNHISLSKVVLAVALASSFSSAQTKTKNVIFVMTDGLRWQEVFQGADKPLVSKQFGRVDDLPALRNRFWRETPEARREALMPFLWSVVAKQGQIFGNRGLSAEAVVTNGKNFSYPGYSETLCGFADPRVDSNDPTPNPNVTVLEWLHKKPAFQEKVAGFSAWGVIPAVINKERAGFPVIGAWEPLTSIPLTPELALLNALKADTPRVWADEPFDNLPFRTAMEYLKARKPRVLYLSLGETDDWAHGGNYALYLDAANRVDSYLRTLWETIQAMPEYRDSTTLVFSTDHGRGVAPKNWKNHGGRAPDSKYIWMAFLGPDTKPLGERSRIGPVGQNQIASTIAALLGEDYVSAQPKAGKPILDVLPH